ncbi:MAG TPA: LuxR C-terminal-related transcriptional regulator [Acidimicrobiales bacterium]|jgi:ATP/maltotriose-dependent transcriptional regulator MalT|nr:LuxR C-terminal-related transcriptional regulator [Acidimicrobiales bacterium]
MTEDVTRYVRPRRATPARQPFEQTDAAAGLVLVAVEGSEEMLVLQTRMGERAVAEAHGSTTDRLVVLGTLRLTSAQQQAVDRSRTASARAPGDLPDPLSDREARVLRFLPTHLSAPEIASELYVSVNTVKTHIRHVYAKLGVTSRTEAVQRARTLGLLSR